MMKSYYVAMATVARRLKHSAVLAENMQTQTSAHSPTTCRMHALGFSSSGPTSTITWPSTATVRRLTLAERVFSMHSMFLGAQLPDDHAPC